MKVTCFCIRQITGSLTLSVRHLYSVARQTSIAVTYAAKTINQSLNFTIMENMTIDNFEYKNNMSVNNDFTVADVMNAEDDEFEKLLDEFIKQQLD